MRRRRDQSPREGIIGMAERIARHMEGKEVEDVHLLLALLQSVPFAVESALQELGKDQKSIDGILDGEAQIEQTFPPAGAKVPLAPQLAARLDECPESKSGGEQAELRALARIVLEHPSKKVEELLHRLEAGAEPRPECTEEIVPIESTAEYLSLLSKAIKVRAHADRLTTDLEREGLARHPLAFRSPSTHVRIWLRRAERDVRRKEVAFAKRASLTESEKVFPVALRRKHDLTALQGRIVDLVCVNEIQRASGTTIQYLAKLDEFGAYPRNIAAVIDAVTALEDAKILTRTREVTGVRVWEVFGLTHDVAKQLYVALANDPISAEDAADFARGLEDLARE